MEGEPFLFQFFYLYNFGVEQAFEFCLFLFYFSKLIGGISQLCSQDINLFLELVDRFDSQLQLEPAFLVSFGLRLLIATV
jgi:hypothetical protein